MKIMIGTPTYTGSVDIDYHLSVLKTVNNFRDVEFRSYLHKGSLVSSARNIITCEFLKRKDFTHLLFIDDDISWEVEDINELLKYEYLGIVGGLYPTKNIDYNTIAEAVKSGVEPNQLNEFTGKVNNKNFDPEDKNFDFYNPISVNKITMGFTLIKRDVLENIIEKYPKNYYHREGEELFLFFDTKLLESNRINFYYGEDTYFSKICKSIGYRIYLIPWVNPSHIGKFKYERKIFNKL